LQGVDGASIVPVGIDITISDGSTDHADIAKDGPFAFKVPDERGFTITVPSHCQIDNPSGMITGGASPPATVVRCDGLAALKDPGFSAPLTIGTSLLVASFLVQETSITPTVQNTGA